MIKATVIIPAFNENERINNVVEPILNLVDEIIVVDDGSAIALAPIKGVTMIRHSLNQGKAAALKTGFLKAKNEMIITLDADLVGLKDDHLNKLACALAGNKMAVGVFSPGLKYTNVANFLVPSISGQRAFYKKEAQDFFKSNLAKGYGVDKAMYDFYKKKDLYIKIVVLTGLSQVTKEQKLGIRNAIKMRKKMYREILKRDRF